MAVHYTARDFIVKFSPSVCVTVVASLTGEMAARSFAYLRATKSAADGRNTNLPLVTSMWGSLRLAPITTNPHCMQLTTNSHQLVHENLGSHAQCNARIDPDAHS